MPASARFCPSCGSGVVPGAARTAAGPSRTLFVALGGAAVAVTAAIAVVMARGQSTPKPGAPLTGPVPPVPPAAEAPPDLSTMTPREAADSLYNRVMRAAQAGDEATVARFTPMALQAYQMLGTLDSDARYHVALIKLHTGDIAGAKADGEAILKAVPGHLFGYLVLGTVARFQKDDAELKRLQQEFLGRYDGEMAKKRPEYADHPRALEDFRSGAQGGS